MRVVGREGLSEPREFEIDIVDVALGGDVVFMVTGKGRMNSLRLYFFSVTHADTGGVT